MTVFTDQTASACYLCEEIVNLAQGSQLVSYDDKALSEICARRILIGKEDEGEVQELNERKKEEAMEEENAVKTLPVVKLMSSDDLSEWKDWFSSLTPEQEAENALLDIEYNKQGRGIRKSRSKISLSETDLWQQVCQASHILSHPLIGFKGTPQI
jgi:hypothetical protein